MPTSRLRYARRIVLPLIVLGILAYRGWQERPPPAEPPVRVEPAPRAEPQPDIPAIPDPIDRSAKPQPAAEAASVSNQTIRDLQGKVVYRGPIDLRDTLTRIERGERLRFPNDGIVFQNRERRLPRQPAGYYHEFVHPTPGLSGPGPQRIVTGERGEIYYTPDHYRTFQRIDTR